MNANEVATIILSVIVMSQLIVIGIFQMKNAGLEGENEALKDINEAQNEIMSNDQKRIVNHRIKIKQQYHEQN